MSVFTAAGASFVLAAAVAAPPATVPDVSLLDLIETEIGYTSIVDNYYKPVAVQRLLDGARAGLRDYLRSRGIAHPDVAAMHAAPDGRGAVPAIERQIGLAVARYGKRVEPRGLVYAAIRGETAALGDPYSTFFSRQELRKFTAAVEGERYGGVGVVLARDENAGAWRIDEVLENGPAASAGVVAGDVLATVDDAAAAPLDADQLSRRLRGRPGTVVRLGLERRDAGGSLRRIEGVVVRAQVTQPTLSSRQLAGVGYIVLRSFDDRAGAAVRKAALALQAQGARALVLDLRQNGGGYERASVAVAADFVAKGPIVTIVQRRGKRSIERARGGALSLPMVALVDGDSASGAEIVAAALQESGRAQLVGTKTYGKGLVQTMFPLPDGSALKLTTARYLTAGGHDIDRKGVVPDVVVAEPPDARRGVPGSDPQLDRALQLLSASAPP